MIRVADLGKRYRIKHNATDHVTLAEVAFERLRRPLARAEREEFWALREVSFEVRAGEVLGLIGGNGAGKSTLLKMLTRITAPTTGQIELWGRVGSLLEVGTGFHGELTGRENIYLNGAILGMSRGDIDREFDAIVEFAGVARFLDTPVKRYSSGMYVRLAFAVAAHLDTEILLLDEVLAVGDADFQARCLERIRMLATTGRTVILVSHSARVIAGVADRTLLLDTGRLTFDGPTNEALATHSSRWTAETDAVVPLHDLPRSGTGLGDVARMTAFSFVDGSSTFVEGETIAFDVTVEAKDPIPSLVLTQSVQTIEGFKVGSIQPSNAVSLAERSVTRFRCSVPASHLAPGRYTLSLALSVGHQDSLALVDMTLDVASFEVLPRREDDGRLGAWHDSWGAVRFPRSTVEIAEDPPTPEARKTG